MDLSWETLTKEELKNKIIFRKMVIDIKNKEIKKIKEEIKELKKLLKK